MVLKYLKQFAKKEIKQKQKKINKREGKRHKSRKMILDQFLK